MKKKMLSIVLTFCLLFSLVPAVHAEEGTENVTTLEQLTAALADETVSTIILDNDISLGTEPLTISRGVTIDGTTAKNSINYVTDDQTAYTITVSASGVTLKNLTINNENGLNGVNATSTELTIENCYINASRRGVNMNPSASLSTPSLLMVNTDIINPLAGEQYGVYYATDNRGLALNNVKQGAVTVIGGNISGYKYAINVVVGTDNTNRDAEGTSLTFFNTNVRGWAALNLWSAATSVTFNNCELTGVNCYSGGANDFATIKLNDGIYNGNAQKYSTVKFVGGSIISEQHGSNTQMSFSIDSERFTKLVFDQEYSTQQTPVELFNIVPQGVSFVNFGFAPDTTEAEMSAYLEDNITGLENVTVSYAFWTENTLARLNPLAPNDEAENEPVCDRIFNAYTGGIDE